MLMRMFLLMMAVPIMLCGAMVKAAGLTSIPLELRRIFPFSWSTDNPVTAFFGAAGVIVLVMLIRPRKSVLISDFAHG